MPVTRTCTFCGNDIEPGTGKMYVRKDGTIHFFCSHKCQTNQLDLGRIGRRVRWTRRYVKAVEVTPRRPSAAPAPEAVVAEVAEPAEEPEETLLEGATAMAEAISSEEPTPEAAAVVEKPPEEAPAEATEGDRDVVLETLGQLPGVGPATAEALWEAGYTSLEALRGAKEEDLTGVKGIGPATARKLLTHVKGGA